MQGARDKRITTPRVLAATVASVALLGFLTASSYHLHHQQSMVHVIYGAIPAATGTSTRHATPQIEILSLSQEQLVSHMQYWNNSRKIDSAPLLHYMQCQPCLSLSVAESRKPALLVSAILEPMAGK